MFESVDGGVVRVKCESVYNAVFESVDVVYVSLRVYDGAVSL